MLVLDNRYVGKFTSAEFTNFVKQNGIWHMKSAPYHPTLNGLAEGSADLQSLHEEVNYWYNKSTCVTFSITI